MKKRWLVGLLALFIGCLAGFVACADNHSSGNSGMSSESEGLESSKSEEENSGSVSDEKLEETDVALFTFTLLNNDTYELTKYNGGEAVVVIPSTYENKPVTTIGEKAFRDCYVLTRVVIPNSVVSIGADAFFSCINLTRISVGGSLSFIGEYALSDCPLKEISVAGDNASYKVVEGNLYTKDGKTLVLYAIGKSNTSFVIPDGVVAIGNNAFRGAKNLTEIIIPNSVTTIGNAAFYACYMLEEITIPDSVILLGDGMYGVFDSCSALRNATIGNGVTYISNNAFANCRNLTSVTVGAAVNGIAENAFSGCSSLTEISVNAESVYYKAVDGNLYTKDGTVLVQYATGKAATVFRIPEGVTTIGKRAFTSCANLQQVVIPASVVSIGEEAFFLCAGLTKIVIPDTVTSVGFSAFRGCNNLNIYCETECAPYGWDSSWNYSNSPVIWGYTGA